MIDTLVRRVVTRTSLEFVQFQVGKILHISSQLLNFGGTSNVQENICSASGVIRYFVIA